MHLIYVVLLKKMNFLHFWRTDAKVFALNEMLSLLVHRIISLQATLEDVSNNKNKAINDWKLRPVLRTILSCGLIAEKEPGCPMWGELPSMAE